MATITAVAVAKGGQQRSLPLPDDPTTQQLRDRVIQRGSPGGGGFGFMWPQRPRDCASQQCVPDRVEAAALGSRESAVAPGAGEFAAALGALTPLATHVPVSLAGSTGGPVVARASTVLPCAAVPKGSLSGLSRMNGMHSRLLVSGLPRSLPSLPRSPAAPCLPCVEGRQRAAPQSSEFPPTTAPTQTLHMDVWGPAPVGGTDQERYFLLVVDDYKRYTTVFTLWRKVDVSGAVSSLLTSLRSSVEMGASASPHKNGIAERRIGLIMEVARTSMIHAVAPHFLWSFSVRYAAHQLNLWPRVSEPETSPTLRWTGKVGDASVFRVWGMLSLVRDAKVSKLSSRTLLCVFLGFPTDAPPWQFYHPRERRVFSSQDVTFDKSVCLYRLHLHASHPVPLAPLFLVPIPYPGRPPPEKK
ncbi:unnamed protein product [Closterium sp. NIES-53]